jgi:UDP-N-acetylmuramate dehydrogenase
LRRLCQLTPARNRYCYAARIYWRVLIQENVPLAPLTTLQVGGPARFFTEAPTVEDLEQALAFAGSRDLPVFVLGGGSNLVVSDKGWPGLVLKLAICGIEESDDTGRVRFDVGAGEEWDNFVARAVARNCVGVECMSGIPGSVGGTPVQNVGAYGQEAAETIDSVQVLDRRDGQIRELCNEACGFSYRTSIFNTSERGRFIILRVSYVLTPGGAARIEYADLKKYFAGWTKAPTVSETREAVREIRARKAMLIIPGDEDCRSAGSFFKNPVLTQDQFDDLNRRAAAKNLTIPNYPALATQRKVSAAWLVEHSGFERGFTQGHVDISRKHALAIVNRGDASAAEVIEFKNQIQERVRQIWGVSLDAEPVMVGF